MVWTDQSGVDGVGRPPPPHEDDPRRAAFGVMAWTIFLALLWVLALGAVAWFW